MYSRLIAWHFGLDLYPFLFPLQLDEGVLVGVDSGHRTPNATVDLSQIELRFSHKLLRFMWRYVLFYLICLAVYLTLALINRAQTGSGFFGLYLSPTIEMAVFVLCCVGALFFPFLWTLARRSRVGIEAQPCTEPDAEEDCFRFVLCERERKSLRGIVFDALVRPLLPTAVFRLTGDIRSNGDGVSADFMEVGVVELDQNGEKSRRGPFRGTFTVTRR